LPRRKEHELLSLILTGRKATYVHKAMDSACKVLGKKHRVIGHSLPEIVLIAIASGDPIRSFIAGLSHLLLDKAKGKGK